MLCGVVGSGVESLLAVALAFRLSFLISWHLESFLVTNNKFIVIGVDVLWKNRGEAWLEIPAILGRLRVIGIEENWVSNPKLKSK